MESRGKVKQGPGRSRRKNGERHLLSKSAQICRGAKGYSLESWQITSSLKSIVNFPSVITGNADRREVATSTA